MVELLIVLAIWVVMTFIGMVVEVVHALAYMVRAWWRWIRR